MRVFKFGGASVKDANGIKNVYDVLQQVGFDDVLLVVSAMGKTTNALEVVIKNYFEKSAELQSSIQDVKNTITRFCLICLKMIKMSVFTAINQLFSDLEGFLKSNKSPNYNFVYDQIVSFGEMISTTIISHYFNYRGLEKPMA